jgi:hypothetical protein
LTFRGPRFLGIPNQVPPGLGPNRGPQFGVLYRPKNLCIETLRGGIWWQTFEFKFSRFVFKKKMAARIDVSRSTISGYPKSVAPLGPNRGPQFLGPQFRGPQFGVLYRPKNLCIETLRGGIWWWTF